MIIWRAMEVNSVKKPDLSSQERRDFIEKCGRFALVTPPTIAVMLAADGRNYAEAFSGGGAPFGESPPVNRPPATVPVRRRRDEATR